MGIIQRRLDKTPVSKYTKPYYMRVLRTKLSSLALVVLIGYLFATYECLLCCEAERTKSLSQQQCCVQCCPNHNLVPANAALRDLVNHQDPTHFALAYTFSYQNPYLTKIDPPPISLQA